MPTSSRVRAQLNGKVERSHRSDEQEFYQFLTYKGDVGLEAKLKDGERFYNLARPHGAFNGKTPNEALRDRLWPDWKLSLEIDHVTTCSAHSGPLLRRATWSWQQ